MGSEADIKPGDALRAAMLAVRNVGYQGGYIVGHEAWQRMVAALVDAAKKEGACGSIS